MPTITTIIEDIKSMIEKELYEQYSYNYSKYTICYLAVGLTPLWGLVGEKNSWFYSG